MNKQDIVTAPVALGAIAWPQVHKIVEWIAAEAQLVLPILGTLWLLVQIAAKVYTTWIKGRR
ncbi:hypothetical protein [Roseibium salinum]|uniref:Holin n=1 Tax=Roseibium salinum TaxID=1604349 RepID=A0ABT3QY22_9HYPH|nr:hypothetical protein [Roseibium sp. DSM 29163]MCX2721849.1 hypothetical protein [Roseibium sp. DSM 29163]